MGKITFGSQWDVDNLTKIGVTIPKQYTIANPNMPTPKAVSTCDTAYFAALRAKHEAAKARIKPCGPGLKTCAEKYASFIKQNPSWYNAAIAARYGYTGEAPAGSSSSYSSAMGWMYPSSSSTGCSTGTCSSSLKKPTSSCSSCRSKKQGYNKKKPKSSRKSRKCKSRRNR